MGPRLKGSPPRDNPNDAMAQDKAEKWLAEATWTVELDAAFAALDTRCRLDGAGSFAERWPADRIVDGWIEAAFVDVALGCVDGRPPRLRETHARVLVTQTRRGFGWEHSSLREPVRARSALAAALVGAWDLVATALGGRPLAQAVSPNKSHAALGGLVRHVATAAKNGLGEASCAPVLASYAQSASFEPATFWALARLAIEGAGRHPCTEVPERWRTLADGRVEPTRTPKRSAVDDPRVSVFERYMHLLEDTEAKATIERDRPYIERSLQRGWDHAAGWVARAWVLGLDEAITVVRPALERLDPVASTSVPSPGVPFRAMLGLPTPDGEARLLRSLLPFHRARELSVLRRYRWSTRAAAIALAAGDTALVMTLTPGATKGPFRAGKWFGDDPRPVLRYFAAALEAKASRADVAPAFVELLVSRAPKDGDDSRTGGAWEWESLLCLAYVYFHRLGGARAEDVPRLLRATLRGEAV